MVDEVLDRVEKNGCFTAPSLGSVAMDMVGKVDRRPIVKRFREYLATPAYGTSGTAGSTGWTTWRRSGKAARQLPLEYAVRNLRPPELFNRLVYLSRNNDRFLDVVGNYRRPASLNYINYFTRFDDRQRERALEHLHRRHNPSLDEFIIESYNWLAEKPNVKHYGNHAEVTWALVNANSDRIRKFLEGKWNESAESRGKLIKILRSAGWTKPHMAWLVPLIAELPDSEKLDAVGIIDNINTDQAWALLEEWADGNNEELVRRAKWRLDKRAKETNYIKTSAGKGADLIAGKIKPDDLLAGATACVWTDKGYVPEGEIAEK